MTHLLVLVLVSRELEGAGLGTGLVTAGPDYNTATMHNLLSIFMVQ